MQPECSIIITQDGWSDSTIRCLESLLAWVLPNQSAEVIVVDDGSVDGSFDRVGQYSLPVPFMVLWHSVAQGFAASSNEAAGVATGEYLVFLNHDTLSFADWLGPMIKAARRSDIGVVGAKLLYPDGTIQSAGLEFVSWGPLPLTAAHRFRGADGHHAESACLSQEVLAVAGACLLIRRDLFRELQGFDECFLSRTAEVDLCLKVHEAGFKVWYEAQAVLISLENQSGQITSNTINDLNNELMLNKKWLMNSTVRISFSRDQEIKGNSEGSLSIVVYGSNNLVSIYTAVKEIFQLFRSGDRLILFNLGSEDGTKEFLQKLALANPSFTIFEDATFGLPGSLMRVHEIAIPNRPTIIWNAIAHNMLLVEQQQRLIRSWQRFQVFSI